ncbi:MAG: TldD/PmbA family protein [Candidatus Bathyarchaeia archaeon]|nr:TldD/PmbA family protein [Candidatus Bathyarchaeota archaeon]
MEEIGEFIIEYAGRMGAEYAEARVQADLREAIIFKNGILEAYTFEEVKGIGIRVLVDGSLGFASTNKLRKDEVKRVLNRAFKMAKASSKLIKHKISMGRGDLGSDKVIIKPRISFTSIDPEARISLLKEADEEIINSASALNVKVPARIMEMNTWVTEKLIKTSDGANIYSVTPRVALFALITLFHPQRGSIQRYINLGECGGWETAERWNISRIFSEETSALSRVLMEATKPPAGEMDVVLGPELVGISCHESCGHPSEADRILGREAAQAGETYLKPNSIGLKIGSKHVNIVDDPTVRGSFGFYLYDDEGVKARRRVLVKEGVINEFLHNRETASVFNVESNGSSRAVAYNREPIIRMANTFFLPGNYSKEELFEDIREGIYIKSFMEWNIDDRRFNQRYVGLEAYRIENGEIKEPIKSPVLEITTIGLWSAVDAAAKDLEFQAAYCGKGDPMQGIPVWTGGPHIRLRRVRIGGGGIES